MLDDSNQINQLDTQNVYQSVVELPQQLSHAVNQLKDFKLDSSYQHCHQLLMTGMGGSGLGARIIESIYGLDLPIPIVRLNDYRLPSWVNSETLVVCSSFSGTTEEVVANAKSAVEKKAPILIIASGGALIDFAIQHHLPFYQIDPQHNPSKQPRMASGYSVAGQLLMLSAAHLIQVTPTDLLQSSQLMQTQVESLKQEVDSSANSAKQMAQKLHQKIVIFVSSAHLVGSVHTVKNQLNENSKNFSAGFVIPELNHHLMEGLKFPEQNSQNLIFVFIKSNLYPQRIQQRFAITADVISQNHVPFIEWQPQSGNLLDQAFEFIQFGSFVSFYLSMLNHNDPAPIPWVDYFKNELGQSLGEWK